MRHGRKRILLLLCGAAVPLAGMSIVTGGGGLATVRAFDPAKAPRFQLRLISQAADDALGLQAGSARTRAAEPSNYLPGGTSGPSCPTSIGGNIKVNQNCLNVTAADLQGRGQANNETAIAVNPNNPKQLIAASNDYELGDGLASGTEYSSDGGKTWQDSAVPLEFTRGSDFSGDPTARMYWQGGGDPSVAWDTHGDAFFTGLHFNRGSGVSDNPDYSSAVYIYRSVGNGGASWDFPGTPVVTSFQATTPASGVPLIDKPYMTIDDHTGSRFRDRIYVSWTDFAADGTAYIYEAWSADYGRSFSSPVLVSKNSALCPNNYSQFGITPEKGNGCDENQFSDPFTGSDGNLYIAYSNYNTDQATSTAANSDNRTQVLLSRSTNGGKSFSAPVQVGYYYDLPDCGAYQGGQDEFRACVPEQGSQQNSVFRATNYPSGGVDPTNAGRIVVTYGSYINKDSKGTTGCRPNGVDPDAFTELYHGVKTPACANKILVSESTNGGTSFSATGADPRTVAVVPQQSSQAHADQWFQWLGFGGDGRVVVSYYDRQYGSDITNADNDITLSHQTGAASAMAFASVRVTTSSMPNPTEFPDVQGNSVFFGDYAGIAVSGSTAHPLWSDTRSTDLFDCPNSSPPTLCLLEEPNGQIANDEDIFSSAISF